MRREGSKTGGGGDEEEEEMKDDLSTLYMILNQYSTPKRIN